MLPWIAIILTSIKVIKDIMIRLLESREKKLILRSKNLEGKVCDHFSQKDNKAYCSHPVYRRRMRSNNDLCLREKCNGFNIKDEEREISIVGHGFWKFIVDIIDLFPIVSTALLAINELVNNQNSTT